MQQTGIDKAFDAYHLHRDKPPLHARIAAALYIAIQQLAMFCISAAVGTLVFVQTLPSGMALTNICGAHLLGLVVTGAMWRVLYVVYKKEKIS